MISLCVNAYWFGFIGLCVATTIPAPGNGSGWMYLVSMLRAGLAANACRTVHGRAKAALAPAPYFRKVRLVIMGYYRGRYRRSCAELVKLSPRFAYLLPPVWR